MYPIKVILTILMLLMAQADAAQLLTSEDAKSGCADPNLFRRDPLGLSGATMFKGRQDLYIYKTEYTPLGELKYLADAWGPRWLCLDDRLILEASQTPYSNQVMPRFIMHNNRFQFAYLKNGKIARRPQEGESMENASGRALHARLVLQEGEQVYGDLRYWFLDFTQQEQIVIGPLVSDEDYDYGENFSVIWNKTNAIIVLDHTRENRIHKSWKIDNYKPMKYDGEEMFVRGQRDGSLIPIISWTGKDRSNKFSYEAFVCSYAEKKCSEARIQEN